MEDSAKKKELIPRDLKRKVPKEDIQTRQDADRLDNRIKKIEAERGLGM